METKKLPESWKEATVTLIQKIGPKNLVENDRPISLTSIVCKKMHKCISDVFVQFLGCI
jgi:hypothetical protein